jgi:hypothetical protein
MSKSQSQSYIATAGRSISKSWCRAPSGTHDQIFIVVWQLRSCFCGAPSLTRGRVCLLYMLLVLASAVFLGSESLGSRDHILLSQFWDFPFCRRRYSTPTPHGSECVSIGPHPSTGHGADHIEDTFLYPFCCCLRVFRTPPRRGPTCHNTYMCVLSIKCIDKMFLVLKRLSSKTN